MAKHPGIEYLQLDGVPGEYFRCGKLSAELNVENCARRWRSQQGKESIGRPCYRCPVGASHAGQVVQHVEYRKRECIRCHELTTRLVGNLLCVSCYNRQQEVLKGKDRRGQPPHPAERLGVLQAPVKKLVVMHPLEVSYLAPGSSEVKTYRHVGADRQEAIMAVLRQHKTPPIIILCRPVSAGEDLFGGYHRQQTTLRTRASVIHQEPHEQVPLPFD